MDEQLAAVHDVEAGRAAEVLEGRAEGGGEIAGLEVPLAGDRRRGAAGDVDGEVPLARLRAGATDQPATESWTTE